MVLPSEIWNSIFSYVTLGDKIVLNVTCKLFNNLLKSYALWQLFSKKYYHNDLYCAFRVATIVDDINILYYLTHNNPVAERDLYRDRYLLAEIASRYGNLFVFRYLIRKYGNNPYLYAKYAAKSMHDSIRLELLSIYPNELRNLILYIRDEIFPSGLDNLTPSQLKGMEYHSNWRKLHYLIDNKIITRYQDASLFIKHVVACDNLVTLNKVCESLKPTRRNLRVIKRYAIEYQHELIVNHISYLLS